MQEIETFWNVFGKIAAILALIAGLFKSIQYLWGLTPTNQLKSRIGSIEEKQARDYEHLQKIDAQLEDLQNKTDQTRSQLENLNEGIQRIGKSQIALLRHTIDGNGIEKMREEADDLTEFFIDR